MLHYYYCFTVRALQALKEYLLRLVLLVLLLHRESSPHKEEYLPPHVLSTSRTTDDEYIAQDGKINNKMKASKVS